MAASQQGGPAGGRSPRHRRGRLAALVCILLVVVAGGVVVAVHYISKADAPPPLVLTPEQIYQEHLNQAELAQVTKAFKRVDLALPSRAGQTAPAYSSTIFTHPLTSHQVLGYLPYWSLSGASSLDYSQLTTIAYFSLGISARGSIEKSGQGWDDMGSQNFSGLISSAHAAHVRVLLTIASVDGSVLDALSSDPAACAATLVSDLRPLLKSYSFDGVDLDLEGTNEADRAGFARFVALVSEGVHGMGRGYTVTVDVYPQSAGDSSSFYDAAAIGRSADYLFIMGYDMEQPGVPSANAPLTGSGLTDVGALQTYTQVVPRSKLILGTPWYGVDWTLVKSRDGGPSVIDPVTLVYSQIASGGHTALWDPGSDTVWSRYSYQGHVHEVWFDNGVSLALKTAVAAQYKIAGVGIWALGMDGGDSDLLSALTGGAPVVKLPLAAGN
jgi:hypothetical protein